MESWGYIVILVVVIVLVVLLLVGTMSNNPPPNPPPNPPNPPPPSGGSITDCSKYGAQGTPVGQPGGPMCAPGTVLWNGVCDKDLWTQYGGVKTAVETVYYGPYGGVKTKCGIGIYDLDYGAPCPMFGPGYFKTAVCTCQYKGYITTANYNQKVGVPDTCAADSDYFKGYCVKQACPSGYKRTGPCTCSQ